jgi:hypothetical protein
VPDAAGRQGLKPLSATCPCYRCRLLLGFAYADRDSKGRNVSAWLATASPRSTNLPSLRLSSRPAETRFADPDLCMEMTSEFVVVQKGVAAPSADQESRPYQFAVAGPEFESLVFPFRHLAFLACCYTCNRVLAESVNDAPASVDSVHGRSASIVLFR